MATYFPPVVTGGFVFDSATTLVNSGSYAVPSGMWAYVTSRVVIGTNAGFAQVAIAGAIVTRGEFGITTGESIALGVAGGGQSVTVSTSGSGNEASAIIVVFRTP